VNRPSVVYYHQSIATLFQLTITVTKTKSVKQNKAIAEMFVTKIILASHIPNKYNNVTWWN